LLRGHRHRLMKEIAARVDAVNAIEAALGMANTVREQRSAWARRRISEQARGAWKCLPDLGSVPRPSLNAKQEGAA